MSNEQNKPGFTPGPWKWCEGWSELPYAIDPDDEFAGPKYADLALMGGDTQIIPLGVDHYDYIFDACGVHANAISEADRNLIAAAPDLYETLEGMLVAWCGPKKSPIIEDAKAALAKARGEATQ
jgi:hypothetical protein